MTIGIDARLYGAKHRGNGRYTQKLIEHLEKIDSQNQYVVFLQKDGFDDYRPGNPNFAKVLADFRAYSWSEQLLLPRLIKKHKLDFVHFTHFNVPFFYFGRFVVTIHDLIISHYPDSRATTRNFLVYKIKLFFYRLIVKAAAQKAALILAVSQFTKDDLIKQLEIKSEKIQVTYEGGISGDGYGDVYRDTVTDKAVGQKFLAGQGLGKDYLLYVGAAYPHKNLEKLIMAFAQVANGGWNGQLVLAGKIDFFYERLKKFIQTHGDTFLRSKVVFTGYVSDEELACLYRGAKAYVFPSLLEGFGLPPLEAQNYGLPVICARASCLPEILGESAVYFDPQDIGDMAQKMESVLADENLRRDLAQKGRENLKKYSWEKCADLTFKAYQKIGRSL